MRQHLNRLMIAIAELSAVTLISSCNVKGTNLNFQKSNSALQGTVLKVTPTVAKPGQIVQIIGKDFTVSDEIYSFLMPLKDGTSKPVKISMKDPTTGSFAMPEGAGLGLKTVDLLRESAKISNFNIVADQTTNSLPILITDQSKVCSTEQYIDRNGDAKTGTKDCTSGKPICKTDGEIDCVTSTSFKAASTTSATAGNIKQGATIAGVTGTYSGTDPYATLQAWDLRAGVSVAGITGLLKTDCRNGATLATFDQTDYPKSATVDNTTDTITIAGHGYVDNDTVRYHDNGVTIAGLSYSTTYYVKNSTTNTFQLALTAGGAVIDFTTNSGSVYFYKYGNGAIDIWDSIDNVNAQAVDYPNYTGWSSANVCGGLTTTSTDSQVWLDVTTTGDGITASTCNASPANCSLKDKIAGHEWHKADTTSRAWSAALSFCDSLTYNGKTDWRLPTQMELMTAYSDGIASTVGGNWLTLAQVQQTYASSTSQSTNSNNLWIISLGFGSSASNNKSNPYRVICIRP